MKKILFAGLIMLSSILFTGCIKISYDIDINSKNELTVTETKAMKKELLNTESPNFEQRYADSFKGAAQNYKSKGYEVKEFEDDNYRGLSIIKRNTDFTNGLSALPDGFKKENPNNYFKRKVGLIFTTYTICLVPDLNNALSIQTTGESPSTELYKPSKEAPISDLTIRLPQKAYRHNADKVINDRIYQWDLTPKGEPIFVLIEYKKLDLSIFAGVISLILLIGGALYIKHKSDNSDAVKGL